jgi:hypothetical protein
LSDFSKEQPLDALPPKDIRSTHLLTANPPRILTCPHCNGSIFDYQPQPQPEQQQQQQQPKKNIDMTKAANNEFLKEDVDFGEEYPNDLDIFSDDVKENVYDDQFLKAENNEFLTEDIDFDV